VRRRIVTIAEIGWPGTRRCVCPGAIKISIHRGTAHLGAHAHYVNGELQTLQLDEII
jgi:hypothetical protein